MCRYKGTIYRFDSIFSGNWICPGVTKHGQFGKTGERERRAGGMETCLDERKGKMNLMNHTALIRRFFKHHSAGSVTFLPFLSLSWLPHFPAKALILYLIHLMPAVARAFLLWGLVQIAWSLKQTFSTESQHRVLERALARMSQNSGLLEVQLQILLNLTFLILKNRNNETCPFCRK